MLSGGFYKAAAHRVIEPPTDQREDIRLGMFYFACADDEVKLAPLSQSPMIRRLTSEGGVQANLDAPTMAEWMAARLKTYAAYPTPIEENDAQDGEKEARKGVCFGPHH